MAELVMGQRKCGCSRTITKEARLALGDLAAPSTGWYAVERDAWAEVLAIADATAPFSFTEMEPLVAKAAGEIGDVVPAVEMLNSAHNCVERAVHH